MSKSSTFKAIKVCCSLITPFTSFTTVFLKIQGSASNHSEIYPNENSTHVKLAFTHTTPCVVCTPHCHLVLLECLTYLDPCILMDGRLISCPYAVLLYRRQHIPITFFLHAYHSIAYTYDVTDHIRLCKMFKFRSQRLSHDDILSHMLSK